MSKTKRMMVGITSTAMMLGLTGCTSAEYVEEDIPDPPEDTSCSDWEWDAEDGVWECDDSTSTYYRSYFYGGTYYKDKKSLYASSAYKTYKSSSSFKGSSGSTTTTKKTSGFGNGSTSTGG